LLGLRGGLSEGGTKQATTAAARASRRRRQGGRGGRRQHLVVASVEHVVLVGEGGGRGRGGGEEGAEGVFGAVALGVKALAAGLTIEQVAVLAPHGRWRLLAFFAGAAHGLAVCLCAHGVVG